MLPRYSPFPATREASPSGLNATGSAFEQLVALLAPGRARPAVVAVPKARQGLLAHYESVREELGPGCILLPVQICPVVPAVIRAAGLEPRPLDGDGTLATPDPGQYAAALSAPEVIGMLVAPMSGYVQGGWSILLGRLSPRLDLVLDLAQAPFSAPSFGADFLARADAVVFSFGLGKGFDTGGGLLLDQRTTRPIERVRAEWHVTLGSTLSGTFLRLLISSGLYGAALSWIDGVSGSDVEVPPVERTDPAIARFWLKRLPLVASEFDRAAQRSETLGRLEAVRNSCVGVATTCSPASRPLRQILRLNPGPHRNTVLGALRAAGLDCAPAGEPFPQGADPGQWPAAEAFTREAIRLPFFGRFSEKEFTQATSIIKEVLTRHGV